MQDQRPFVYFQPNHLAMRVSHSNSIVDDKTLSLIWDFVRDEAQKRFNNSKIDIPAPDPKVVRKFTFAQPLDAHSVYNTVAFRDITNVAAQDLPVLVEYIHNG